MKPFPARKPVFVDSSGQRHRSLRRLGLLLAVPAVGYVVLLVSSVLGGPRVDTPLIPLPEAAKQRPAPLVTPAPERTTEIPKPESTKVAVTEVKNTPTASERPPGSTPTPPATTPTAPTTTAPPTVVPTSSSTPTITPGPPGQTPGHGKKPTVPPGRTKTPGKP